MRFTTLKLAVLVTGGFLLTALTTAPLVQFVRAAHAPRAHTPAAPATQQSQQEPPPRPGTFNLADLHRLLAALIHPGTGNTGAPADDKKDDKPALSGSWVKKDVDVKFEFDKKSFKLHPHGEKAEIVILCDYTVDKDGLVKAKVTGFEAKEDLKKKLAEKLPVGTEFSFKWTVNKDTATLGAVKGEHAEAFKSFLEGDFSKK